MERITIEQLWYFRAWCCDFELFTKLYKKEGETPKDNHSLANHMWRKFTQECKHDVLMFWRANDLENQRAIVSYLNSKEFKKRFDRDMH